MPLGYPATVDSTGSLTGHILAQGNPEGMPEDMRSRRLFILLVVFGVVMIGALIAAVVTLSG